MAADSLNTFHYLQKEEQPVKRESRRPNSASDPSGRGGRRGGGRGNGPGRGG